MAMCIGCDLVSANSGVLCGECRRQMEEASAANAVLMSTAKEPAKGPCECREPCVGCGCS